MSEEKEPQVALIHLEPYHPSYGLLAPFVFQRILDCARQYAEEMDPEQMVKSVATRFYAGDPTIGLLAFMQDGKLVGHAVASIESDGVNSWVFVQQVKADGNVGDAVARAIVHADQWAMAYSRVVLAAAGRKPIQYMLMATHRSDRAWVKAYGFETERYVMRRDLGSSPQKG